MVSATPFQLRSVTFNSLCKQAAHANLARVEEHQPKDYLRNAISGKGDKK